MLRPEEEPGSSASGCRDRIREMVKTAGTGAEMVKNGAHPEPVTAVRPRQLEPRTLAAVARVGNSSMILGARWSQMAGSRPSEM
jgi:hypothetical protein